MSAKLQYLLDTNVLSETRNKNADRRVVEFLSTAEPSSLYISVLTLGELRKGAAPTESLASTAAQRDCGENYPRSGRGPSLIRFLRLPPLSMNSRLLRATHRMFGKSK